MRKLVSLTLAICLLMSAVGCTHLSRSDEITLRELKSYGIRSNEIRVKHPAVAGGLNLLPGFGNFYLAVGTEESEQWLYGFLNLLTWPLSVLWGIPEGAIDAGTINKKETVYYYLYDVQGKKEFQALKDQNK